MSLIDAEKCPCLVRCYSDRDEVHPCDEPCDELREWFLTPAYDIDKVVEELEAIDKIYRDIDDADLYFEGMCRGFRDALDIVKKGGIDDR